MSMEPFHYPPWRGFVKADLSSLVETLLKEKGKALPHGRGGSVEIRLSDGRYVRKWLRRGGLVGSFFGHLCGGPMRLFRAAYLAGRLNSLGLNTVKPVCVAWKKTFLGFNLVVVSEYVVGVDLADSGVVDAWRAAAKLAHDLSSYGYCHLDFHPRNIRVVDGKDGKGVVLLDVEDLRRAVKFDAALMWRRLGRFLIKHKLWQSKRDFWLEGVRMLGLTPRYQERQLLLSAAKHLLYSSKSPLSFSRNS